MLFRSLFRRLASTRSALLRAVVVGRQSSTNMAASNKAILIFLHGLGDQGSSWEMSLAPMLPSHIKCICPTAPEMPVTLNMGMRMNSWFDLRSLDPKQPEDAEGIAGACKRIHALIEEQEKGGVASDRIMLGGFSQGGALGLYAALKYPKRLAGAIVLSSWLPLFQSFPDAASEPNKHIPIIQCHGEQDFVVPFAWGKATEQVLSSFVDKDKYAFKSYADLGHCSSQAEMDDVLAFIRKHLAAK